MSARNNGGPAFPELYWSIPDPEGPIRTMAEGGMTLRDYFAAKAMQGLVNQRCYPVDIDTGKYAYQVADLMLKAREEEE